MIETNNSFFRFEFISPILCSILLALEINLKPEAFDFEGFGFFTIGLTILMLLISLGSLFFKILTPEQIKKPKEKKEIKDLSESEQVKLLLKTIAFSLFAFALYALTFYLGVLDIEGKLNFIKEKLPLQKIEVVDVEGIISFENANQYQKKYTYFKLQEYPDFVFSYVYDENLNNEFNHLTNTAIYKPGEKVMIKIRKKDFEKFIINSENIEFGFNQIRFYELTVENKLLLRKKHIIDAK